MKVSIWIIAIALLAVPRFVFSADSPRVRETNDFGWRFARGDHPGAEGVKFDDSQWQAVDLPHDWSIYGPFDLQNNQRSEGALPMGIGWYRKTLNIPADDKDKQVSLEFDGIYENGSVYVNGKLAGTRPYGYTSVCYNVTPLLNFGADNTIAVRVDNSLQPNCRWYPGSGIYRHTYVIVTDGLHIPQWGTYVTVPRVTATNAVVSVQVKLDNQRGAAANYRLESTLLDKDGNSVAASTRPGMIDAGAQETTNQHMTVPAPKLWSIDDPYMYTVRTRLRVDGQIVDQYDTPIGIRTLDYDVNKGLLINGQHVKLNGVCLHFDGGPVGNAVPDGVWIRRLKLLKEMGCNSIRWSHAPPDPAVLDLCDQLGITVFDEAFDQWRQGKNAYDYNLFFDEWWQRDTTDFIDRDRNHPCVVIWSAGNEIHDEQTDPEGWKVLKGIVDVMHKEDPMDIGGRPVTSACDNMHADPQPTTLDFVNQLDVAGYNYVNRWNEYAYLYFSPDRAQFPTRKFIGTEDGSMGGARGVYADPFTSSTPATQPSPTAEGPVAGAGRGGGRGGIGGFGGFGGRGRGTAPSVSVEGLWKEVRANDYVIGDYMWTGIDYLGEGVPGSGSGVIDRCGLPKDGFYFYQSQWTTKPMVHIFPTWTWPGHEGQTLTVYAYSNCDSVQLFVNNKAYASRAVAKFPVVGMSGAYGRYGGAAGGRGGRGGFGGFGGAQASTSDLHLSWDIPYEPGTLKAVGTVGGQEVATDVIYTATDPASLDIQVDKTTADADGRDVVHVVIRLLDAQGHLVTNTPAKGNPMIHFAVTGPGKIIGVDNGAMTTDEDFKTDHRSTYGGMCLALVQTTRTAGPIQITAHADGFKDVSADITAK